MIQVLIALAGGGFILYGAVTGFSTLSAITQMGSIQERTMPWATQSRKERNKAKNKKDGDDDATATKAPLAEKASTVLSTATRTVSSAAAAGANKATETVLTKATTDPMEQVLLWDKIVYTTGIINVCFTAYLLGIAPHNFYLWHAPKYVLYFFHRWHTFRKQNQHYLLYDFCYWANTLSLVYCFICPDNYTMFQIFFMVANGPLAWAVLAFSQSLIFHSAPHMTSVFIHTSPMLLSYAIRWYPSKFTACSNWPECDGEDASVTNLLWNAHTKFYLWWVVLYYLWVYVVMDRRIKERGYKTLFDRVSSRGPTKFLTKISSNDKVQKLAYMIVHVAFATFTMLLATAYWYSQAAHLIFIVMILSTSAWNASGFYFTVFANRYATELHERACK